MKTMIIPGNGNTDISENWYLYLKSELEKLGIPVVAKTMPDADIARKQYWLPFIEQQIGEGDDVILVGHSSGALAIMRYLETHKVLGVVLVGACYTDLGEAKEKQSGYYDGDWQWDAIKGNSNWIVLFASKDDPYIPVKEPRHINEKLGTEYHEYVNKGHFNEAAAPEILEALKKHL
ncbi:MAG: alpha/beta hydrolase [Candidatus Marsarchaeota archaeon]|nr:alpha/beta hydrolase [Candidatus Marsarchaeota archaeon]